MADHADLSIFAWPLLRLILCGGKGLAPAWGPVLHTDPTDGGPWVNTGEWAWNPNEQRCVRRDRAGYFIFDGDRRWAIPLDAASPWPARLALVAAWMKWGEVPLWAAVAMDAPRWLGAVPALHLSARFLRGGWEGKSCVYRWLAGTGAARITNAMEPALTTLPQHLGVHPPIVALLLALYDMPEIRARVEAAHV